VKLGLRRHGDTHDPTKGSDRIPGIGGFIRYDFENVGDWLSIQAKGYGGPLGRAIGLLLTDGGKDFQILATDSDDPDDLYAGVVGSLFINPYLFQVDNESIQMRNVSTGYEFSNFFELIAAEDLTIFTGDLGSGGSFLVRPSSVGSPVRDPLLDIEYQGVTSIVNQSISLFAFGDTGDGDVAVYATGTSTIYDASSNPALQVQSDGSVHIRTGQTITADL
jgi:hypothetical protein